MKKKILITGATGFLGSNLASYLLNQNYEVYLIIRPESKLFNFNKEDDNLKVFVYDGQLNSLIEFLKAVKPICTFHLASYFIAEHTSSQLNELIESNIRFGLHLLEAMKEADVKTFINTGTSWQHYNNEDYNPVCLYAATKQAFENLIDYYVKAEDFKVITLKLFDTYGETDNRSKLINLLNVISIQQTELELSPGNQILNLVHVSDVCNAYVIAMKLLETQNKGSHKKYAVKHPKSYTLKEVINLFEKVINKKIKVKWGSKPYRRREVMSPWDSGELLPNWNAFVSLEEGFRKFNN